MALKQCPDCGCILEDNIEDSSEVMDKKDKKKLITIIIGVGAAIVLAVSSIAMCYFLYKKISSNIKTGIDQCINIGNKIIQKLTKIVG